MNIIEYENYRERKTHTGAGFPYNTYLCSIPLDFTSVPIHWHDECEIIYVKKGSGTITVDFHEYNVASPAIFLIMPGRMHSINQYGDSNMEYENILFHPDIFYGRHSESITESLINPIVKGLSHIPELMLPSMNGYNQVAAAIDACDEICSSMPDGYQLFVKGKLFELMYSLSLLSKNSESKPSNHKQLDKIRPVLKYIEENYQQDICVAEAAKLCSFSEAHFMRFFKDLMGSSFVTYLNDYRLTMATRLLLMSDSDILSISSSVGFQNLSHFNRAFKKKYGMPPSQYRKSHPDSN